MSTVKSFFFLIIFSTSLYAETHDQFINSITEAKSLIKNTYLNGKADKDITANALQGILSVDPYSMYLNPEDYQEMMEGISGHLVGIGVEMQKITSDGFATIVTPIDGSPAIEAGILPNDLIIEVNGESLANLNILQVSKKIRGTEGQAVKLKIARNNKEILEFSIIRKKITLNAVSSNILESNGKKIGYLRLRSFTETSGKDFESALKKLNKSGTCHLIVDLRNNPGGLLDQAVHIASIFLDSDKVITKIMGRDNVLMETMYPSHSSLIKTCGDLILLVNDGSASASEILASALNDHDRAILIGKKTFGKGLVQSIIPLSSIPGAAAKLTIAEYISPNGTKIDKIGIEADVKIPDEEMNEYINEKLKMPQDIKKRNEIDVNDPYIKAALKILKIKK